MLRLCAAFVWCLQLMKALVVYFTGAVVQLLHVIKHAS
jgi:hypothetical protein